MCVHQLWQLVMTAVAACLKYTGDICYYKPGRKGPCASLAGSTWRHTAANQMRRHSPGGSRVVGFRAALGVRTEVRTLLAAGQVEAPCSARALPANCIQRLARGHAQLSRSRANRSKMWSARGWWLDSDIRCRCDRWHSGDVIGQTGKKRVAGRDLAF